MQAAAPPTSRDALTEPLVARPRSPEAPPGRVRAARKAMRLHQWAKNGLVVLPALLAHEMGTPEVLVQVGVAFLAMGLVASGTYVVNDLLDRERDRLHPTKKHRPFASGALTPQFGWAFGPSLVALGFGIAWALLPLAFVGALGVYLATTLAYSFKLKSVVLVDVVVLAALYALRVLAGGAATSIAVSEWLLAFSLFFFLGLALLKRYAELRILEKEISARDNGRGYTIEDAAMLRAIGPAAGFMAVLVFALYVTSPTVAELYARPDLLWLAAPLLAYWTMRMWLLAHRGDLPDEPVAYAIRDVASYVVAALTLGVLVLASIPV
ncbi:MAG: UbiA family prenyltransferase [Bacteroidota bacterium]